ncbi:MAG: hypothetical protein ACPL0C_02250 [Candidatus Bathyarchaeales archaeon]
MPKFFSIEKEELNNLCDLIITLDSVRAFRRPNPEVIKAGFQKTGSKEFTEMWKEIRHDVEKIAYTPLNIEGLPSLMRVVAILKMLVPIASFLMILTLATRLRPFEKLLVPPFTIFKDPLALVLTTTFSLATMIALMATDYTIRRRVIKYEESHMDKFSKGRERIKKVIEKLVEKLAKELKRNKEDPNKYKMMLFYKYRGLKVVKEKRGRIFKRKYPLYEVICSIE